MFKTNNLSKFAANNFDVIIEKFKEWCEGADVDFDELSKHICLIEDHTRNNFYNKNKDDYEYCNLFIHFDNVKYYVSFSYCNKQTGLYSLHFICEDYEGFESNLKYYSYLLNKIIGKDVGKNYFNSKMLYSHWLNSVIEEWENKDISLKIKALVKDNIIKVKNYDLGIENKLIELGLDIGKSANKWKFQNERHFNNMLYIRIGNKRLYMKFNNSFKVEKLMLGRNNIISEEDFKEWYNNLQ
mgnify:CR=1 FL=1